jgi:hypothetical protein
LSFDHEDAGSGGWVGDVLVSWFGVADAPWSESFYVFTSVVAVVHVDGSIEDHEDFGPDPLQTWLGEGLSPELLTITFVYLLLGGCGC